MWAVLSLYTGWLRTGFPSWIVIIPNTLDSRIPQLIINRGFEHRSTSDYQRNHPIPSCNSSRQWRAASGVLNLHCEIDGDGNGWGDCFSCQNLANNTPARLLSEMKRIESYQGLNTSVFLNILKLKIHWFLGHQACWTSLQRLEPQWPSASFGQVGSWASSNKCHNVTVSIAIPPVASFWETKISWVLPNFPYFPSKIS